jgi:hypothetical protein
VENASTRKDEKQNRQLSGGGGRLKPTCSCNLPTALKEYVQEPSSFLATLGYGRKFLEKMRVIKEWDGFIPCLRNIGNVTYSWR